MKQHEINCNQPLHAKGRPYLFTPLELSQCNNIGDAYFTTWKLSGKPRKAICHATGIDSSTLTRIFNGTKNMPDGKERIFYENCNNYFALQWKAWTMGLEVTYHTMTDYEKARAWDEQQKASA